MGLPITCPGVSRFVRPKPESITCPKCRKALEIWSDEDRTRCDGCGAQVIRESEASCLDYCEYADKCRDLIGQKLKKARNSPDPSLST
ncbi:MAG: hypothetical protein QXK96_01105 [Candidatus Bathyarchaeia archaeon]